MIVKSSRVARVLGTAMLTAALSAGRVAGQDVTRQNASNYTIPNNNTWVGSYVTVSGLPPDAYVYGVDLHFSVQHPRAQDLRIQVSDGALTEVVEFMTPPYGGVLDQSWTQLTNFNFLPVNGTWVLWVRDENTSCCGPGTIDDFWIRIHFACGTCPYIWDTQIEEFVGLGDLEPDGFWEYYNFDVAILGGVFATSATVRAKIHSTETGQVFTTPEWTFPLPGDVYQPWAFTDEDFAANLAYETMLDFDVELWDPTLGIRWDSVPMYVSLPVEPYFPFLDEVCIEDKFYIADEDSDGYFEEFEFDIATDADMEAGTRMAGAIIRCLQTGQSWTVEPWTVSGTDNLYHLEPFWDTRFSGFQGNTELYFKVELWNEDFTVILDETWDVVGQPILADNWVLPDYVTIDGYAVFLDQDNIPQPIRLATVRAFDLSYPFPPYAASTDLDGYYTITIANDADGDGVGADVHLWVETQGFGLVNPVPWLVHDMVAVVDPGTGYTHKNDTLIINNTSPSLYIDLIAENELSTDGAFSVFDAAIEAYQQSYNVFGATMPMVEIHWPEPPGETYYVPSTSLIHIAREDRWDRDVICHEYGHYVAHQYGFAQGAVASGIHIWDVDNRVYQAQNAPARNISFSEGFATWYSVAVQYPVTGDRTYVDYDLDLPGQYTLPPEGTHDLDNDTQLELDSLVWELAGQYFECMNACALWDLYDSRNTTPDQHRDFLSLGVDEIWQTVSTGGVNNPDDITEFWPRWFEEFPTLPDAGCPNADMTEVFLLHHMTFLPQRPENPSPQAGAGNLPLSVQLSWDAVPLATSYDVYIGVDPYDKCEPVNFSVTGTSAQTMRLEPDQLYFWTVLAKGNNAVSESWTWFFSTGACDCPYRCDFNEDGFIDALDLAFVIDIVFFGQPDTWDPYCPTTRADFTGDGFADNLDVALMVDYCFFGGDPPAQPCP